MGQNVARRAFGDSGEKLLELDLFALEQVASAADAG